MSLLTYLQSKSVAVVNESSSYGTIGSLGITEAKSKTALAGSNLLIINRVDGSETPITLSSDINTGSKSISFTPITIEGGIMSGRLDWVTFSNSGISNSVWSTHTGDTGKVVDTSILEDVGTDIQSVGIVVPFDCTLIGFRATTYRVGNYQSAVGLFVGTPAYNDNATIDLTLRAYGASDNSAGPDTNYSQRPVKAEDLTRSFALSAGDIILPAALGVTTAGGNLRIDYTIVLKTTKLI